MQNVVAHSCVTHFMMFRRLLALGLFKRLVAMGLIALMAGATYVHLVVSDPSLFPLQPTQPIIPAAVIVMSLFLLWRTR